jgi:molybdopterin-synthase adenylyltransferase
MSEQRFARQCLMFGEPGQRKIESQHVGLVGLGGMGSQVAQGLAYLGVHRHLLVDDDRIDETNLNRVVGASAEDIGRLKVDVARDQIMKINPKAEVLTVPENLRTRRAIELLVDCSVIFGCVDHDGLRLVLTELAAAYEITLFDLASEIFPQTTDRPFDFGGRVVVARPGDYCLFCADQIDRELAKQDLETPEIREQRRKHGYGLSSDAPSPSVFPLNGVIANLGVTEFLAMTTGIRDPVRMLSYRAMRGVVLSTTDAGKENCFTCKYLRGQRERANIWRYLQSEQR